jgi:hypothetical protein
VYKIVIPKSGWVQERITGAGDWQRDMGCPRVVVKQEIGEDRRLSVALVQVGSRVEIEDATIEEWQEEAEAEQGGYWVEGPAVAADKIRLVQ